MGKLGSMKKRMTVERIPGFMASIYEKATRMVIESYLYTTLIITNNKAVAIAQNGNWYLCVMFAIQ